MSLKFTGGKMTALVGHSGSGKSTLLNMIPRIYYQQVEVYILIIRTYLR
jgi:subfamily B ATP-binding cassette protein MsbA